MFALNSTVYQAIVQLDHNPKAIQSQLSQRLEHDLTKILPTLHGIATYLDDPHLSLNPNQTLVTEFQETVELILGMVQCVPNSDTMSTRLQAASTPTVRGTLNIYYNVIFY